jgi:hypothetical protein
LRGVSAERLQRHPGRREQVPTDGNETPRRNRERAARNLVQIRSCTSSRLNVTEAENERVNRNC